jgi:hypothetical protein
MASSVVTDSPRSSALSLFVSRILTNHADHILSLYYPATLTEPLYRRSHFHPNSSSGDKKTQPEEILSQERFSFQNYLTFAGTLSGLSSNRKGTFLP